MSTCMDCGEYTHTTYSGIGPLCPKCYKKRKQEKIMKASETITKCSDFASWDSGDMSELFWIHLGKYIKEPNAKSFKFIELTYRWACHDSHGLSNSFRHAMEWAGIDLLTEETKWRTK